MSEKLIGRLIPTEKTNKEADISKPFKFNDIETCPLDLEEGHNYIITCWDTNIYIKALDNNHFEIVETHGSELVTDKEYILIHPIY